MKTNQRHDEEQRETRRERGERERDGGAGARYTKGRGFRRTERMERDERVGCRPVVGVATSACV